MMETAEFFLSIYNYSIYWLFLSLNSIDIHIVVDTTVVFESLYPGFESRWLHNLFQCFLFFFVIIITVRIQHYCLYSDSPILLPLMMPRPPAPAALCFVYPRNWSYVCKDWSPLFIIVLKFLFTSLRAIENCLFCMPEFVTTVVT